VRKAWVYVAGAAVIAAATPAVPVMAQVPPGPQQIQGTVEQIVVQGNNRIDLETILSYMLIRVGDPFDTERMDESLKALFDTGLFSNVVLRREGNTLIVQVQENPIVNQIAFEGNRELDDEELLAEIQLGPRSVYTAARVQEDVRRLLEIYRFAGRFAATVEPKVIPLEQNRVNLVFEVNEGESTGIGRISFVGNEIFSDSRLREAIETKESAFWRFLSASDTYDPDRLEFDKELLRRFYLANGYADFRVLSAVAELTPDREDFFITFTVEEGERYRFGPMTVETDLPNMDTGDLEADLAELEGEWYDADVIEETIAQLTERASELGFAFVEVRPEIVRDRENRTMAANFRVDEGPRVFVERIEIIGNERTRDEVIRREMRLDEGDAFNSARIRLSRQRIENLGFFENVEITNAQGSAPDQTVVTVEVVERSTGEFSLGAGFSSEEGALGSVGLRERNFLGRGQNVGVSFTLSQRTQQIDLSFTEPYFLDRNLRAGFDLFRIEREFSDESSFDSRTTGGRLRMGYEITDFLSQNWFYALRQEEVNDIDSSTSPFIRQESGERTVSAIGQELMYDRRDDRQDPTSGYFVRLINEVAGVGGSERFVKTEVGGGGFIPVTDDVVLSLLGEAGIINGFGGKNVSLNDRFFIGGDSFRGFDVSGVGARDVNTDDALGANKYYVLTTEVSFPLGLPEEFGIRGSIFTDIGSAWDVDLAGANLRESNSIRIAGGVGLSWASPFGPVRVDVGIPIVKEDFDETRLFFFNFGTRF